MFPLKLVVPIFYFFLPLQGYLGDPRGVRPDLRGLDHIRGFFRHF